MSVRWDQYGQLKPSGNLDGTDSTFARLCPFSPAAKCEDELAKERFPIARQVDDHLGRFETAFVGHVVEGSFRESGSSGGMATWLAAELLRRRLVDAVAHVVPSGPEAGRGFFRYRLSRTTEQIRQGAKSRYHPVELSGVMDEIRTSPGRYAVVGIPCFIKAVHLLCAEDAILRRRIAFTLGLFCGHMKSRRFVESFAWQMGVEAAAVRSVDFRAKNPERPANWYTAELVLADGSVRRRDWWHLVDGDWGAGFFQNPACNFCDDVVAETADISFGDAWVEPYSSDGRGTNVVIVRTRLLNDLLGEAAGEGRLELKHVDAEFVIATQAAGFRQRREGLAYRLAQLRRGPKPRKRVGPDISPMPLRRRLIYRLRRAISAWSHRVFYVARRLDAPVVYLCWARVALGLYHGLTYSRGWTGRVFDALGMQRTGSKDPPSSSEEH